MLKKQDRDNIRLRTLSFYQKEGEVYNELITVLINLRSNSNLRLSMSPAKVLNEASCICIDVSDLSEENMKKRLDYWWNTLGRDGNIERLVIFSTMYIMSTELPYANPFLSVELERRLGNDEIVFPFFDAIPHDHRYMLCAPYPSEVEKLLNDLRTQLEAKENENKRLREELFSDDVFHFEEENSALKEKYELLARESRQKEIDFKAQIADLEEQCKNKDYELSRMAAKQPKKPITNVDKVLNFDNIMAYIESRGSYDYCDQLFKMLDKLTRRILTDEQLAKIDALEAKLIAAKNGVTINNDIHDNTGDIMPGTVNMNK